MRFAVLVASLLVLPACSSEEQRAKEELTFLENNDATPRERCDAARRWGATASKSNDVESYRSAQVAILAKCTEVDTFPAYADIPGGMPKASDKEIADALAAQNDDAEK